MIKTSHEKPQYRLTETPKLGPILREATEIAPDPERLNANRRKVLIRIKETQSIPRPWSSTLFPRRHVALAALSLMLLASAGAAAVFYFNPFSDEKPEVADKPRSPQLAPETKSKRKAAKPQTVEDGDILVPEDTGYLTESEASVRSRRSVKRASDSTLGIQVKLFNQAKQDLRSGDPASALKRLDRLNHRYSQSPLKHESKELRAHALARLKRYGEAEEAVKALIRGKASTRKKAQLYRFLGDLQIKQNRCDRAVENYRLALGLGLPVAEENAAKAGIRKCTVK